MSGLIYPTFLFVFVRVGLIPHSTYHAGDVARRGAPDQMSDGSTRVDRVRLRSTGRSIARALIQWIITAAIDWRGSHLSRWIVIQGAKIKRFYNAYQRDHPGAPSTIGRLGLIRKRSIVDRLS